MHFFSVSLVISAVLSIASAAAVSKADAKSDPFFHALNVGYATVPYVNKRDAEPELEATKVKREPFFENKATGYFTYSYNPLPKKRELTNIRPLLTRTEEHMLFQRTYPSTPTSGPDAGKCGATAGYACSSQMGACCGGYGTVNNKCGDTELYCAGACQKAFGWCTEPRYQIAFDVDNGDVMWDPVTNNVFDANMGDGMIYFGYPPLDPTTDQQIPWPSTI